MAGCASSAALRADVGVGLVGLPCAARPLAELLGAFGARVSGYDPAVHASDPLWPLRKIAPLRAQFRATSEDDWLDREAGPASA